MTPESRIQGLLEAGNKLVEERRAKDARIAKLEAEVALLRDALDNLIIGIGMGWDLDGFIDAGVKALGKDSPA